MTEYSKMAKGKFTSTGSGQAIYLPFQPDYVEFFNYTAAGTTSAGNANANMVPFARWDSLMGQGFAVMEAYTAASALVTDTVIANGISTFSAGLSFQYGPYFGLGTGGGAGIAKTSSTVLTVTTQAVHGLVPGNWIVFQNLYETTTTGMQQIAGIPFEVLTAPTTTTFTIGWVGNASGLTAITTAATGNPVTSVLPGFKKILYPVLYAPGWAIPWSITLSSGVVTVNTTAPHNFKVGQEIGFRIPSVYGGQELNELPNNSTPGSPQYYYVVSASKDSFTFNYSGSLSTFSVNTTFASFRGNSFPMVVAVGDVNTGGTAYSGGALYPSPLLYNGFSTTLTPTINGPAIHGAYVNNTSQGFIIGAGVGTLNSSAVLVGTNGQVIYWKAYLHDLSISQ